MKIGLALGSGSARGIAHIGVVKVLQKEGIKIDYIAGTSIGALVGAYYALYGEIDGLEKVYNGMTKKDFLALVDLNRFSESLIKGNKFKRFLDRLYKCKKFKHTKIPFSAIATDIRQGKVETIHEGSLSEAVRASVSIPGIFRPVKKHGKLLVDGGLLMPTPIEAVKKMGASHVIAIDLPFVNINIKKRLNMADMILVSSEVIRKKILKTEKNTLIIRPVFKDKYVGYKFLHKEFVNIGAQAAQKKIPAIRRFVRS